MGKGPPEPVAPSISVDPTAMDAELAAAERCALDEEAQAVASVISHDLWLLVTEFVSRGEVEQLMALLGGVPGLDGVEAALALARKRRAERV